MAINFCLPEAQGTSASELVMLAYKLKKGASMVR